VAAIPGRPATAAALAAAEEVVAEAEVMHLVLQMVEQEQPAVQESLS
jgi:hypothetical protein